MKSIKARWPHGWYDGLRIERCGSEPWPGTLCCTLAVSLSTRVYKWVPADSMLRVTMPWSSIPFSRGGGVEILGE